MKKWLTICVCLVVVAGVSAQRPATPAKQPRRVQQPREVVEAYRVCREFQHLLAENFDFERAFEATFVKDPARRREVAIAESEHRGLDLSQVDTDTVIRIYKNQAQLLILMLPVIFADGKEEHEEFVPPAMEEVFERKPPTDPHELQKYAAELDRGVTEFRSHVENLARKNPAVAKNRDEYRKHLLTPLVPPHRIVKPMTAYSKGRVLRPDEKYHQVDDCAVIREGSEMRLIGYTFLKLRF
jgi:hypothetical protein